MQQCKVNVNLDDRKDLMVVTKGVEVIFPPSTQTLTGFIKKDVMSIFIEGLNEKTIPQLIKYGVIIRTRN